MTPLCETMRNRTRGLLVLPLLALTTGAGVPAEAAEVERYELQASVDPATRQVRVAGRVSLKVGAEESTLSFGLHETFRIAECLIDGAPARCVRGDPEDPDAPWGGREVSVNLPEASRRGVVVLEIRYDGVIENRPGWGQPDAEGPFRDDSAGPDRVELALYSNWYPFFGFGPTFDVDLDLELPRGWAVTCIGQETERIEGEEATRTLWQARTVNDVVVVASPKLRSKDVSTSAGTVRFFHTRLPDDFLLRMGQEAEQILLLFSRLLGPAGGGETLQHVYSPRDWGQGFARPGMIILSEGRVLRALAEDPDTSFLYGDAHEAGHLWWRHGAGQGDWINETFAEYFALLAIQSIEGEPAFQEGLAERRASVEALAADAPALAVVPAYSDGDGYTIRYMKGALMLHAFRGHLGDDAFFRACRGFYESIRGGGAGTADFRVHWSRELKDDAFLEAWLDSPGPGPVSAGD